MIIADDFGLAESHNSVILELLKSKSLTGTSVLIRGDISQEEVKTLLELRETKGSQVGLHLNLTEALPNQIFSSSIIKLWLTASLGLVDQKKVAQEIQFQFKAFKNIFGFTPDYVDGHQHCHAIPSLWKILSKYLSPQNPTFWVRSPAPNTVKGLLQQVHFGGPKSLLIIYWGWRLKQRLKSSNINTNENFFGIIKFMPIHSYPKRFEAMLTKAPANSVVMVHPGCANENTQCDGHPNQCRQIEAEIIKARYPAN